MTANHRRPRRVLRPAVAGCVAALCAAAGVEAARGQDAPLLNILERFAAADVPAAGPAEPGPTTRTWPNPTTVPTTLATAPIGNGIGRHPMLYAGEGYNTIFLVDHGSVVWTYSPGRGGEIDDVWMLSDGHVLYSRMDFIEEVTPQKTVAWHLDAPKGTEIHTCQPVGLDRVLFVRNGLPPKAILVNKRTGAVESEHDLPATSADDPKTVHGQFRQFRTTAAGTYLAPHLNMNKVVEYDREFREIWSYEINSPWSAVRLKNGNTLVVDEKDRLVREVNPARETVWEFRQTDLPPAIAQRNPQTAGRLANGNTVICSNLAGARGADRVRSVQVIEVTPDKKVVWALQDWTHLGPATTVQLLDEPGAPETPGDLQR